VIHKVYEPSIRARLGTAAHFCEVVVLKLRTVPIGTAPTAFPLHFVSSPFLAEWCGLAGGGRQAGRWCGLADLACILTDLASMMNTVWQAAVDARPCRWPHKTPRIAHWSMHTHGMLWIGNESCLYPERRHAMAGGGRQAGRRGRARRQSIAPTVGNTVGT